jgi:hypothetical protein
LPSAYPGNLYTLNASCTLKGFGSESICRFGDYNRIDIYLNGFDLRGSSLYSVILGNLNTPSKTGL